MIIKLLGNHNYRNLFNYSIYSSKFKDIEIIKEEKKIPDIVLLSAVMDLETSSKDILELKKNNKKLKVVLLSEEPLWDLAFGKNINKKVIYHKKVGRVNQINYFSSNLYKFKKIPYFLTTNPRFILNYKMFFDLSNFQDYSEKYKSKIKLYAFCEKRIKDFWDAKNRSKFERMKLSVLRTNIIEKYLQSGLVNVEGKGWSNNNSRQKLPDWHLDKLSKIKNAYLFGFAIENSDMTYYITEKFFDAIFSGSIPIISSSNTVNLNFFNKVFNINLQGKDPIEVLDEFNVDKFNSIQFKDQVHCIYSQITDKEIYHTEIDDRVKKITEIMYTIVNKI